MSLSNKEKRYLYLLQQYEFACSKLASILDEKSDIEKRITRQRANVDHARNKLGRANLPKLKELLK